MSTDSPRWGTIKQAADALLVSDDTIRRRIASGQIYAERFGPRLIRVDMNSVERFGHPVTGGAA